MGASAATSLPDWLGISISKIGAHATFCGVVVQTVIDEY